MKNMMKEYLNDDYTDNSIINFLNYWMKDGERESNDLDCLYFSGDLRADTLFSVWTPLKFVLDCLNPCERFYKENKYGSDKHKFLRKIKLNISRFLPENDELVKELYKFVKFAETRANYFIWPKQGINNWRYDDFDQVPPMLYKCFTNKDYKSIFDNDDNILKIWIKEEKLNMFFGGKNSYTEENIKPLIKRMKPSQHKWLTEYNEILEMLKYYNKVLEKRYEDYL